MFDKKPDNKDEQQDKKAPEEKNSSGSVNVIPKEFYGGNDPVIYQPKNSGGMVASSGSGKPPKLSEEKDLAPDVTGMAGLGAGAKMANDAGKAKPVSKSAQKSYKPSHSGGSGGKVILIIVILLALLAGVAGYVLYSEGYFDEYLKKEEPLPPAPVVSQPVTPEPVPVTTNTTTEQPSQLPDESLLPPPPDPEPAAVSLGISIPKSIFVKGVDVDLDGLTDIEEEYFRTDSGTWDTDGDGYHDSLEVVNLYSPQGASPRKLIDSGLIQEYVNPTFKYRLYSPIRWQLDSVDDQSAHNIISVLTGEYIDIQVSQKRNGDDFSAWFAKELDGEQISQYREKENRFQSPFLQRQDGLVALFDTEKFVYVITFQPGIQNTIQYPTIMEMVVQSFRPQNMVDVELPEQKELPPLPPGMDDSDKIMDDDMMMEEPGSVTSSDPNRDPMELPGMEDSMDDMNSTSSESGNAPKGDTDADQPVNELL